MQHFDSKVLSISEKKPRKPQPLLKKAELNYSICPLEHKIPSFSHNDRTCPGTPHHNAQPDSRYLNGQNTNKLGDEKEYIPISIL